MLAAWGIWVLWPAWGGAVVAVAALPWGLQWLKERRMPRLTGLNVALTLFGLTAGVGVWASYDRNGALAIFPAYPVGWAKLWGLGLAILLYAALAALTTTTARRWAVALLTGIGAAAAWLFSITHWRIAPPAITGFVAGLIPNTNILAGVLAPLLLLDGGMLLTLRSENSSRRRLWFTWGVATGALMLVSLMLTDSRGAWLALGAALTVTVLWQLARRCRPAGLRLGAFAVILVGGLLAGGWGIMHTGLWDTAAHNPDVANRLWIFLRGLLLVRDYPFTGSGLGNFALVDSTYAQLIHVPTLPYSHALLLDVTVEQGIPGALALLTVWVIAFEQGMGALARSPRRLPWLGAGLLALLVIIVHGMVDDPLYSSPWSIFLWAPVGVIAAAQRDAPPAPLWQHRLAQTGAAAAGTGMFIVLFMVRQMLIPAWYANLGALAQTHTELSWYNYRQFDNPTLDEIRQRENLVRAEAYFNLALTFDPGQVTARTRLAQIALARGDYAAALTHAQTAWNSGHRDRVTRLLLSDALAANGKVAQAAALAEGLTWAEGRLEGQAFYRYQQQGDRRRALYARHVVKLLGGALGR